MVQETKLYTQAEFEVEYECGYDNMKTKLTGDAILLTSTGEEIIK